MTLNYTRSQRIAAEMGFSLLMICLGTVVPLVLINSGPVNNPWALYGLEAIAAIGLGVQFLLYLTHFSKRLMLIYCVVALAAGGFFIIAA